jgi:GNAT superfamily N-acetyltransferase
MSWDDLAGDGVSVLVNEQETARFGRVVLRVVVRSEVRDAGAAAGFVLDAVSDSGMDLAVVRWPARLIALGPHLAAAGLLVVPADTLVYWAGSATPPSEPQVAIAPLSEMSDATADLEGLVRATFDDYPSHYAASPDLDPARVTEGYVEWAMRTAVQDPSRTWLAHESGQLLAFATTRLLADRSTVEVELAGTGPSHRGRGVYAALLSSLLAGLSSQGHDRLVISTQAGNVPVQRLWARAGLLPFAAFTTVHLRHRLL